ncbi:MAG TPA: c-type cytochrome biogenesis protein CcmI [Gallionella sp.]|nr:c-type cytochrome biogenesis protein CcmI [Gallionella sp.]
MTLFWISCAVLLTVALPFVVLPLWCNTGRNNVANEVRRDAANLEVLRDQLVELDTDLRDGMLTQDAYEQGKRELQVRLLEEVEISEQPAKSPHYSAKTLAVVLAILLPLFSVVLYLATGNIKALLPQQDPGMAGDFGIIRSEIKLQELEKKLVQQPENPDGWMVLARSYGELQRYSDAVRAYGQLVKLVPDEAQIWANYADVYAMNNNQSLLGEPTRFLNRALELDGNNTMALALSGSAAMERGDYVAAITHWTKLADLLPPDNSDLQMIRDGIQQARQFLAMQKGGKEKLAKLSTDKAPEKAIAKPISGKAALSPALAGKAAPTDTVFIFARDAQGQKTLLAVLRKQVKDLPLQFTLDDSMAMQPQAKLSGFDQVVVVARISKSGNPIAQPGDLQGSSGIVKPGAKGLNIAIDSIVQ